MMKKLFVSVPMKGRTDAAIKDSMEKMKQIAEIAFGEELEVIPTHQPIPEYISDDLPNKNLWCLGRSIQYMAQADYFIGVEWSSVYFGCNIEREIAVIYNIPIFTISIDESKNIFPDIQSDDAITRLHSV